MEQLPYIDEHSIDISAAPRRVWGELVSALRTNLGGMAPTRFTRALGAKPSRMQGDWRGSIRTGDTLPGFVVVELCFPERLALSGRHRFSHYELAFELTGDGANSSLRARTSAEFPGLSGRAYRALVIGSGAHKLIVRHLLRSVASRA